MKLKCEIKEYFGDHWILFDVVKCSPDSVGICLSDGYSPNHGLNKQIRSEYDVKARWTLRLLKRMEKWK